MYLPEPVRYRIANTVTPIKERRSNRDEAAKGRQEPKTEDAAAEPSKSKKQAEKMETYKHVTPVMIYSKRQRATEPHI